MIRGSSAPSTAFSPLALTASRLLRRVRPAVFASRLSTLCGLTRRKPYPTPHGLFAISPVSQFGGCLLEMGEYEPQMIAVLRKYLHPGGTFIDLGANEGYFSVIASGLVGPGGRVFAIEPQSRLQAVIHTNLELNGCANVEVQHILLSGVEGEMDLMLTPQANPGASSLYTSHQKLRSILPKERVTSRTLDRFLASAPIVDCDLMKVDIEGAEWDVFMNAGEVLRSGMIRNMVIEIHNGILEARGLSGGDFDRYIRGCGYTLDDSLGPWVYRSNGEGAA
jgi:FkbM family methyltransferase